MSAPVITDEPATIADDPPSGGFGRYLVLSAAALALLLVGAAIGMLITQARLGDGRPAADSVDVGFSQDMQVHHLQAVTMATLARERTADTAVKVLAVDIDGTQGGQIGMMTGWLDLWGYPGFPDSDRHLAWLPGAGHHGAGGATMPGMATPAELTKLRSLSGKEFDVYFLQLMLRHHQGGLPMANYAARHATYSVVRSLAGKIVQSQNHDIRVLTAMLAERGAQPLPPPH